MESSIYRFFARLLNRLAYWFDNSIVGKVFNKVAAFLAMIFAGSCLGKFFASGLGSGKVWENSLLYQGINYPIELCKRVADRIGKPCKNIAEGSGFIKLVDNWELVSIRIYGLVILFFSVMNFILNFILSGYRLKYLVVNGVLLLLALIMMLLNRSIKSLFKGSFILRSFGGLFTQVRKESSRLFYEEKDIELNGTLIAAIIGICCATLSVLLPLKLFLMLVGGLFITLLVVRYIDAGVFLVVLGSPFLPTMALAGLCILCVLSLFIRLLTDKNFSVRSNGLNVFVVFFIFALIYGTINSFHFASSAQICLIYLSFVSFYFVLVSTVTDAKKWKSLGVGLILVACLVGLYGILQNFTGIHSTQSWVDSNMFSDIKTRVYSTFDNPNVLGEFLVIMIPSAIAVLWASKKHGHKLVYAFVVLSLCVCILFTWSRGAWLGVALAVVLFLFIMDKRWTILGVFAILLLPTILGSNSAVVTRLLSIGNTEDTSTAYRVSIWMASIKLIKDFWISGIGMGSDVFSMIYPKYALAGANFALHSHNLFLQVWVEMGILGILSFFALILAFLKQSFSLAVYHTRKNFTSAVMIAVTAGLLGYLFQGMTDNVWYNYKMLLIFWIIVGYVSAGANIVKNESESS